MSRQPPRLGSGVSIPIDVRDDGCYMRCAQCNEWKIDTDFTRPDSGTSAKCMACMPRGVARGSRLLDGVLSLRCSCCKKWFPKATFNRAGNGRWDSYCRPCRTEKQRVIRRREPPQRQLPCIDKPMFLGGDGDRFHDCERYRDCLNAAAKQRESETHCCGGVAGEVLCRWYKRGGPDEAETFGGWDWSRFPEAG